MKREEKQKRTGEIVKRLGEIFEEGHWIIRPKGSPAVEIKLEDAETLKARDKEREKLHDELRGLATTPIED